MNNTKAIVKTDTSFASILFVAILGMAVLFGAGFANSAAIHDSAHDMRHATGFACH